MYMTHVIKTLSLFDSFSLYHNFRYLVQLNDTMLLTNYRTLCLNYNGSWYLRDDYVN